MASKYWLKLYYEMLDDPKIGQLPPALRWRFVECLLVAGEEDKDGLLPEIAQMAWRVRESNERYESDLHELARAGLLSKIDGRYLVTNFKKRQEPVSGAERVARYRERKKKQEYYEPETPVLPNGNVSVTNRYTDTDIDTDKDIYVYAREEMETIDPDSEPYPLHNDLRQEMVSAIAGEVKTVFAIGVNSDDFERIADGILEKGITPEQVTGFYLKWWKENGHYKGKPALKSLLGEIDNYVASKNGSGGSWVDELEFDYTDGIVIND